MPTCSYFVLWAHHKKARPSSLFPPARKSPLPFLAPFFAKEEKEETAEKSASPFSAAPFGGKGEATQQLLPVEKAGGLLCLAEGVITAISIMSRGRNGSVQVITATTLVCLRFALPLLLSTQLDLLRASDSVRR